MNRSHLVLAALLAGACMLPAQLPNPLFLPDPLGIAQPGPNAPNPGPPRQTQKPEDGRARQQRHHRKKPAKRIYRKHHGYGH